MNWLQDKVDALQDRFSSHYNLQDDEEAESTGLLQQLNDASTLNRTQRLLGFGVCFAMGMLLSLASQVFILRPVKLATTLTLGNLLSIGSMMFLMGPAKQCENMMDAKRRSATLVYLGSLLLTLLAVRAGMIGWNSLRLAHSLAILMFLCQAFTIKSRLLCLLCIAVQYSALLWYSLSYVPYGREMLMSTLGTVLPVESIKEKLGIVGGAGDEL